MIAAESMLSKRPALRFTAALFFHLKNDLVLKERGQFKYSKFLNLSSLNLTCLNLICHDFLSV